MSEHLLTSQLQRLLSDASHTTLWLADENILQLPTTQPQVQVICNRFDLHQRLQAAGWNCLFNDFDLSTFDAGHFTRILYRISKEKPLVHYLINEAARLLPTGGELILFGDKSEGIKTYARKAQSCLDAQLKEEKLSTNLWRCSLQAGSQRTPTLDDQNYRQLRLLQFPQLELYSKPGLYGWQKVDKGSAFLIEQLPAMLGRPLPLSQLRVLDLGCGSGYLSLMACDASTHLLCTDNNAAALNACRHNLSTRDWHKACVIATDAGDNIEAAFDVVLCNPPFHSGFATVGDLTARFSAAAARLLAPNGSACFVVNQHIALEQKARPWFAKIELHADNGHFRLYRLSQ